MRPYPIELRRPIVEACKAGEETQEEIAACFGVSYGFVKKLWRQWRETGHVRPGQMGAHRPPAIRGPALERLRKAVRDCPDATLKELRDRCGVSCSIVTVFNTLNRLGSRRKKNAARR